MYFERYRRGGFRPAASYSRRALVTATTHDHPPLAGFWTGRDLDIRHEVGLIASGRELQGTRAERERTRAALLRRLRAEGVCQDDDIDSLESLCAAAYLFLTRTPCPLVGVSLDDLAGETDPVNLPGVGLGRYRSWSRRMRRSIEDLLADPKVRGLLDRIRDHLDR
jgi:4-alpha-glucanotransferase